MLPRLTIAQDGLTAADLYRNTKVAFGYNYVDGDLDITHDHDSAGDHGTHVSGIATANRYVPKDGGFASAAETVLACGVAPEAQLLVMKVFGKNGGAYADDYMAAIQDAISLGCDAINLSLGSNSPGFCRPRRFRRGLRRASVPVLTQTDTVVTISAGNAYSAGFQSATGTDLHRTSDPDVDTVGSPGSYEKCSDGGQRHQFRLDRPLPFHGPDQRLLHCSGQRAVRAGELGEPGRGRRGDRIPLCLPG